MIDDWNPFNALGDFLNQLISYIFYPIITFFVDMYTAIIGAVNEVIGLITDIYSLGLTVINFVTGFLSLFLIDVWTTMIIIQITVIIILRVYYFIKDVSIMGNKV